MTDENNVITLTDEEGQEHDFTVIDVIEVKGSEYAILLPVNDDEEEAIILKITKDEEDNEILVDIEDDEEWEEVADTWASMIEEEEQ